VTTTAEPAIPGPDDQLPARPDGESLIAQYRSLLDTLILASIAYKGSQGKTTIIYELMALLRGILVDFEHDDGSASLKFGYDPNRRLGAPLVDALRTGRAPTPLKGGDQRPDLVPGNRALSAIMIPAKQVTDCLVDWQKQWGRLVGVDAHPGGTEATRGIAAAADIIIAPLVFGKLELDALNGMLDELSGYPVIVVPNRVKSIKPTTYQRFQEIMAAHPYAIVADPIRESRELPERTRQAAITTYQPALKTYADFDYDVRNLAEVVIRYAASR
jgi:chromosome partitioning protein